MFSFRFGVCCLFVVTTAGATVSQNCTYLQNEGFPSALAATVTSVQYTVQRVSNGGWVTGHHKAEQGVPNPFFGPRPT